MPESARAAETPSPQSAGAEPSPAGTPVKFFLVMTELLLITAIVYFFDIEGARLLFPVMCVMIGGFAVHAFLPMAYRLAFFACLSAGCVLFVLGLTNGLSVLGLGGVLIGICYLPLRFAFRVLLLCVAAAGLIALRHQWPLPMWPVLGSMFMFRLVIYAYSIRKAETPPSWTASLSYFFMAPNVCFPLFPVVDFNTFRNSWYDDDTWAIYQKGVVCMVRGVGHLLLYRYVKLQLVPEPYELYDVPHIALFMATNYALYLHVSGQFHLIAGLLHLFGFNLPRTHDRYFLASSFTDIWRRINIYWKDFMMKIFFFPAFYALRGRGWSLKPATFVAVVAVFFSTWLLHSWQAFWLLGQFPVTAKDAALWMGVGLFVAVNALIDMRRHPSRERTGWAAALSLSARIVGMFTLVSLFWACWTTPGFLPLLAGVLQRPGAAQGLAYVAAGMLAVIVVGAVLISLKAKRTWRGDATAALPLRQEAKLYAVGLGAFLALTSPWFTPVLGRQAEQAISEFRDGAAIEESLAQIAGYYEDLNAQATPAGPMISSLTPNQESRRAQAAGFDKVSRPADLAQTVELIPGVKVELNGEPTTINRFGMRDRETLTLNKPAGTTRIALVGSSVVMGYGVADDAYFGRLLENRLNADSSHGTRYQVLNFGVGKQWASQRLVRIQRKVLGFEPDAIYYFAHQDEFNDFVSHVAKLVAAGQRIRSPFIDEVIDRAGITTDMSPGVIQNRLSAHRDALLTAIYRTIVEDCRQRGIVPVWIFLPIGADPENVAKQTKPLAEEAGFVVGELPDWAKGHRSQDLMVPGQAHHPHAGGHQLIAEALLEFLRSNPAALPAAGR